MDGYLEITKSYVWVIGKGPEFLFTKGVTGFKFSAIHFESEWTSIEIIAEDGNNMYIDSSSFVTMGTGVEWNSEHERY